MKILIIATGLPYPPDHGRKIRMYYLYSELARRHEIFWICPDEGAVNQNIEQTRELFKELIIVHGLMLDKLDSRSFYSKLISLIKYLSGSVYPVYPEIRDAVKHALGQNTYDVVVVDSEAMAGYIVDINPDIPWVLNTQNIPSILQLRTSNIKTNLINTLLNRLALRAFLKFENAIFPKYTALCFVSDYELDVAKSRKWTARIACVPNGVDINRFKSLPGENINKHILNFTGILTYYPNWDAMEFFCRNIFPKILENVPDVQLQIIGKDSDTFKKMLGPELPVIGMGYVSDPLPWLVASSVVIVPLRVGGGTRIKILEALAAGKPVVSTSIGAEGINLGEKDGLIIADTIDAFADKVVFALTDPFVRECARTKGREKILEHHSWIKSAVELEKLLFEVVR